ncbi:MAG: S8 family serine peptidase, partial [Planctomycetota bacterium]
AGGRADLDAVEGFTSPVYRDLLGGRLAVKPVLYIGIEKDADSGDVLAVVGEAFGDEITKAERPFDAMPGVLAITLDVRTGERVIDAAALVGVMPGVAWCEPDTVFSGAGALNPVDAPDDVLFADSWHLENTGQYGPSGIDVDLDALKAWSVTDGSGEVVVAVFDTGIDLAHPDLNLVPGDDFTNENGDGEPRRFWDRHGTPCAGIICSPRNNAIGTAGIAPSSPVMPIRMANTTSSSGSFTTSASWISGGLDFASANGARITNHSYFLGFTSSLIDTAFASTAAGGMLHFASLGNNNINGAGYPSSLSTVIAVSAVRPTGVRASFSNFGPLNEIAGPGTDVVAADNTDLPGIEGYNSTDYTFFGGTSAASPAMAGVAALIWSVDPDLDAETVRELLFMEAVIDLGAPGRDDLYGRGMPSAGDTIESFVGDDLLSIAPGGTFVTVRTLDGISNEETATMRIPFEARANAGDPLATEADARVRYRRDGFVTLHDPGGFVLNIAPSIPEDATASIEGRVTFRPNTNVTFDASDTAWLTLARRFEQSLTITEVTTGSVVFEFTNNRDLGARPTSLRTDTIGDAAGQGELLGGRAYRLEYVATIDVPAGDRNFGPHMGGFDLSVEFDADGSAQSLCTADFDGDNDVDLGD